MKHTKEALRRQRPTWALLLALTIIMALSHSAKETANEQQEYHHGRP